MPVTLAEELALLSCDDAEGTPLGDPSKVAFAIVGAHLLDLAMAGRIDVPADRVVVRDSAPIGDAAPDQVLDAIVSDKRQHKPSHWLWRLSTTSAQTTMNSLVDKGLVRQEARRTLVLFRTYRYPASDGVTKAELRERLHAVVVDGAEPDTRTAALVGIVHAAGLSRQTFPDADHRAVAQRVERIGESAGRWAGEAVRSTVEATSAAVYAAVVAAVVSSTTTAATAANT
jgi:hypothetical protein